MQTIVKNSTDTDELTVIVDAVDDAGASVNIASATLKIGGSTLAEADFTGTITRRGTSSTHLCVFTQAQSNAFGIGERGYIRIPGTTGALESTYPFLVTEAAIGGAPLTAADIVAAEKAELDGLSNGATALVIGGTNFTVTRAARDAIATITAD